VQVRIKFVSARMIVGVWRRSRRWRWGAEDGWVSKRRQGVAAYGPEGGCGGGETKRIRPARTGL